MNRITNVAFACGLLAAVAVAAKTQSSSDFQLMEGKAVQKTDLALKKLEKQVNGKRGSHNSITFKGDANIVVRTGPEDDMMSFRIQALRNPTLIVEPGTTMKIVFANTDEDMFHCMRFGSAKAPFPVTMSHEGPVGSPDLAHSEKAGFSAFEMKVKAPVTPGTYSYICTIKGHARAGMYGSVIVR